MVGQPVEYMAALNTPLPMMIIGYYLSEADLKKHFQMYLFMLQWV